MNIIFNGRRVVIAFAILLAVFVWGVHATFVHADDSNPATQLQDNVPSVRDVFETLLRVRDTTPSVADAAGAGGSAAPTTPESAGDLVPDIRDIINSANSMGSTSASSTTGGGLGSGIADMVNNMLGSSTVSGGLGASIADSITGGTSGTGTSDIGPFVKCVLIAPIGWPLPTYSTECNATTTNKARLTIIKNTVNGNGSFDFEISGSGSATTSITTSGNSGRVQFLANPGTYVIAELARDGWSQTFRGCSSQHATSTGGAHGNLGWSVLLNAGDDIVCTFENTAPSTPGGGGGCTENCGGGGGNPGGGGGTPGGGGSSGSSPSGGGGGGGGNGPIVGGGGFSPGEVLGATTSAPPAIPGIPNTGAGGGAAGTIMMLLVSFAIAIIGIFHLRRNNY